jgi:hypothetical protein
MDDLKITKIGEGDGGNIYEVEVPQNGDLTFVYTISESNLNWLKANGYSQWEIRFLASDVREASE